MYNNFIIFQIKCKNLKISFDFNNQNSSNFKDKITTKELMSQKNDFVISKFIELALQNKDITIYGDGSQDNYALNSSQIV